MGEIHNWRYISTSSLHVECISKNHRPQVFRASFDTIYIYCEKCNRIYRIPHAYLQYIPRSEWKGIDPEEVD